MFRMLCWRYFLGYSLFYTIFGCKFTLTLCENDPGFELLFASNTDEMENVPVYFDKRLPVWLRGTLIRNGLGSFGLGKHNFTHAFDAFGKICSWKFPGNGSAFFSTKFLQSQFYKKSVKSKDIAPYLMFESVVPQFNKLQKLEALYRGVDNMNVNLIRFFNFDHRKYEYTALNDYWKIYQVDPLSLSTIRSITPIVPHKLHHRGSADVFSFLSSAHPLPEPGTSYHINYVSGVSLIPGIKSKITLVRIKSADVREAIAEWNVDKVPYMHSFSVTQNYVILFASPFYFNVLNMFEYFEPFKCLDWFANEPTTVYVIDLKNGNIKTLTTGNVFTLHHVNAFEVDKFNIVLDISTYQSPDIIKNLEMATLTDPKKRDKFDTHALLKRYHINLNTNKITMRLFNSSKDIPFASKVDMPTINENYRFKKYCYVYGVVLKKDEVKFSHIALVKKDLCGKGKDAYWYIPTHYPAEAWFVPNPDGDDEDDGSLLVPILDGDRKKSYLAIIDAKTMNLTHSAYLPTVIPFSMHGRFFIDLV